MCVELGRRFLEVAAFSSQLLQPHQSRLLLVGSASSLYLSPSEPDSAGPVLGPAAHTWFQALQTFFWLVVCDQDLLTCVTHLYLPHFLSSGWWLESFLVLDLNQEY